MHLSCSFKATLETRRDLLHNLKTKNLYNLTTLTFSSDWHKLTNLPEKERKSKQRVHKSLNNLVSGRNTSQNTHHAN